MTMFETKLDMFHTLNQWNAMTFKDALKKIHGDKEVLKLAELVLKKQGISDKPMNGCASEGLKTIEAERLRITYVSIFNQLIQTKPQWNMADCIYAVCEHALKDKEFYYKKAGTLGYSFERIVWLMCGRMIRSLPSFIREIQLENSLQQAFPKAHMDRSEKLDTTLHCDIAMTINGENYYVWSFVKSDRSIKNFCQKFSGKRYGHVPDGYHVLCPFDVFSSNSVCFNGWAMYSNEYVHSIKDAIKHKGKYQYDTVCLNGTIYSSEFYNKPVVITKTSMPLSNVV